MFGLLSSPRALSVQCAAIPQHAGQAALVALKLEGEEALNSLFHYTLTLQTREGMPLSAMGSNLDLDSCVGVEITCSIELEGMGRFQAGMPGQTGSANQGAGQREISGLITAARFVREDHRHTVYVLEIRPWLHLATLGSNCRVFQDMTVVEVIESILGEYSFAAQKRLIETYPRRDYCTQFNETNFEFVTRLMQEWGISYWFEHSAGVHRLIWGDHNGAFQASANSSAYHSLPYYPLGHKIEREYIHAFSPASRLTSGAYASRDYDYTRPRAPLEASATAPRATGQSGQEVYLWRSAKAGLGGSDYSQPNAGADNAANQTQDQGRQLAMLRMQHLRQHGLRAHGRGHVRGIVPGCTFTLTEHPQQAANTEYIVLSTQFVIETVQEATQRNPLAAPAQAPQGNGQWRVEVRFDVQPTNEVVRPDITQAKPLVCGPQAALVCGPDTQTAEANLYTDYLGRIKVQFMWDRTGAHNSHSSCWVRVASPWAGNQLGGIYVPRAGEEVVVSYYEGDPDLPIVMGSVYNQNNQPPWALPAQQALSGLRSRELAAGAGNSAAGRSNHIVLDDTQGKIQAQLKSDHQHSQLSLGYITRIEDNAGRKDYRGEGFELRTDGHGALRATDGLLISTHARAAAHDHILSMEETIQQLSTAQEQHRNMGALAVHHLAHDDAEAQAVQNNLQRQADEVTGNGHTRSSATLAELQQAHITLSSPTGIASTTPGSTHVHSGTHHAVTAGQHISLASAGSLLASAGKNIGMLANKALRLIAAKGKVHIQAQDNDVEILAQKLLELQGKQGIVLKSDTLIRLMVGAHAIQLTPGGGIEFMSPLSPQFRTAAVNLGTPKSMTEVIQSSPNSKFNDTLYLADANDKAFAKRHYEITRADGSVTKGITGADGGIPILRNDEPEQLAIRILGSAKA